MRLSNIRESLLFAESWNVAWRRGNPGKILSDIETPFNIIRNSFRYWAADPFVYEKNGEVHLFAELYDYILRRGVIGYCKLDGSRNSRWIPIIVEKYHLSYPCIIEYEGNIYLMPESSEAKELVLYQAVDFPHKWGKRYVLREGVSFADTTPIKWKEYGWALTHDVEDPYNPQLILIDLKNLQDDVYVENVDMFQSRPAGQTFQHETKYIRPAQLSLDCDKGYGKAILFYTYFIENKMKYDEKLIRKLYPEELKYSKKIFADGMHTYNASQNYEVIDLKTRRFNILNFMFRLVNKIKR